MPIREKKPAMTAAAAEILAIQVLGHLASEEARLGRFLALTGLTAGDIRAMAAERGFLAAVLDHVLGDEPLLLQTAEALNVQPVEIVRAGELLSGRPATA